MVSFPVSEDQVNRLNSEPLRVAPNFEIPGTLVQETEWAKSFGPFAAKCSFGSIQIDSVQDAALRREFYIIQPEAVTRITFIEIHDPERGLLRLTRASPMLNYLLHNLNNPSVEARTYSHNLLGHVYYSGLLGQVADHKKAMSHFQDSLSLAKQARHAELMKTNGIVLAAMHATGSGVPNVDEARAKQYLEEVRSNPK
jgi:hypothetical protein